MTQDNTSETAPDANPSGGDLFNTAAGWVLFAGIVGLGLSVLSSKYFHGYNPERPEKLGYVIEGAEEEGGGGDEMTMAAALNMAETTVEKGAKVFAKCQSCHSIEQGGANGIGPNLYGIMGGAIASGRGGYEYSAALSGKGGKWDWDTMNEWLKNPKAFADGTKMSFAGLPKIEDRAAVALYMNSMGSNLPVPEFVEAAAEESGEDEAKDADDKATEGAEEKPAEAEAEKKPAE